MAGLCGWFDASRSTPDKTIDLMAQALSRFDRTGISIERGPHYAAACAGTANTATIVKDAGLALVTFGHPRWMPAQTKQIASPGLTGFAAHFFRAFRANDIGALKSIGGDFALAIIDESRGRVVLAIDRSGMRSLTYQRLGDALLFGSTADAIAAHPAASTVVDPQSIYDYVYFHMVPGPKTARKDQFRLQPGEVLTFENGKVRIDRYWNMQFVEQDGAFDALRTAFRDSLREATATALDGERCGAFLSGGTDSSTICGFIGEVSKGPAQTYSIGFQAEGFDEMEYARLAATHFKAEHHEYYVTPDDVVRAVPRLAAVYDQPFGNASAVPTFYCAQLAKQDGMTRMLGGDGGDELFGGNARYAKQYKLARYGEVPAPIRALLQPLIMGFPGGDAMPGLQKVRSYVRQASPAMPIRYESYNLLDRFGPANVFTGDFLGSVSTEGPRRAMEAAFTPYRDVSLINQMLGIDLKLTLADNDLPKVTRMCELAGVDIAFPMLDERVVDFSATLAEQQKLRGAQLRYFFKEALRGFLPDAVITKTKHGFGLPAGNWIQSHAPLHELARDALAGLKKRGIVQPAFVDKLFDEYLPQHPGYYGTMAWVLMMLELWFRKASAAGS